MCSDSSQPAKRFKCSRLVNRIVITCGRNVRCACQVSLAECTVRDVLSMTLGCVSFGILSGVERQALHLPIPAASSSCSMATSEEDGLHLRPSSQL